LEEADRLINQEREDIDRSVKASDELQQGLQNDSLKKMELSLGNHGAAAGRK